jgi:CheY-like chemotaxis protein
MPGGGKLTIETGNADLDDDYADRNPEVARGDYVMLAVTDTGTGMDKATQARIFEPFFTTKGPQKGTGLGLSTAYGIVKQTGGHISVYSEPGHGTSFKVYLPPAEISTHEPEPTEPVAPPARGTETIVLVEDESELGDLAREVLEEQGYTVLAACGPREALKLVESSDRLIDLLLTDVVMPDMSGRQLAEELLALRPTLKVLYMSGYTDDAIVRHGVLDTGISFLPKPFTTDELARRVREVLDESRASVLGTPR